MAGAPDDISGNSTDDTRSKSSVVRVLGIVARNPALRRVELAFLAFNCSEWATWVAMLVYAYAQGGVTESGIVATATLVPAAALAPVAAALGERFPPGRSLLAGYAAQAITCAAASAFLWGGGSRFVAYAFLAGPVVAFTTTRPIQAAFSPGLARRPEELTATNVVSGWVESFGVLAAPAAAGVLLALSSSALVFAVMAAVSGFGALLVAPLREEVPAPSAELDEHVARGVRGGIGFVRHNPHARMLVGLLAAEFVALGALDVLYVELARGVLHRGGDWAGYLGAVFGAGGVLAMWVTARLVGLSRLALPLAISLGVWSAAFLGLAALPGLAGAMLLLAIGGSARATFDVTGRTLLQRVAPPDLLARVFGLLEGLEMAAVGCGALLVPILVRLGGPAAAFAAVGAILPLTALVAGRRMLDIDRRATVPVVEIALLRSLPLFSPLSPPTLESVARALVSLTVPPGTDVIREGDPGDRFYVIADGEVDVSAAGKPVTTLRRGDYFGEIALLCDVARTATVTARTDTRLYALEREHFLAAVTGHSRVQLGATALATQRLDELRTLREADARAEEALATIPTPP
jgi:hypothetical protein